MKTILFLISFLLLSGCKLTAPPDICIKNLMYVVDNTDRGYFNRRTEITFEQAKQICEGK